MSPESPAPAQSTEKAKITIATKVDAPPSGQPSEASDPVLKKAKITVAARMEDPASAEFDDMKWAIRKNISGQSFDIICGHVKGKKKSGEGTSERPFLYLVKENEAFIVGSNTDSVAAIAYRAHCTSPDLHGQNFRQQEPGMISPKPWALVASHESTGALNKILPAATHRRGDRITGAMSAIRTKSTFWRRHQCPLWG